MAHTVLKMSQSEEILELLNTRMLTAIDDLIRIRKDTLQIVITHLMNSKTKEDDVHQRNQHSELVLFRRILYLKLKMIHISC